VVAEGKMLKYIYYINSTYFLLEETINISIIHPHLLLLRIRNVKEGGLKLKMRKKCMYLD